MDHLESAVKRLDQLTLDKMSLDKEIASLRDEISEDIEEYVLHNQHSFPGTLYNWNYTRTRQFDTNNKLEVSVHVNGQEIVASIDDLKQAIKAISLMIRVETGQRLSLKREKK